jgi:hypothetical protein
MYLVSEEMHYKFIGNQWWLWRAALLFAMTECADDVPGTYFAKHLSTCK